MKTLLSRILFISVLSTLAACDDIIDGEINIDPNNPTSTEYQSVLTTAGVGQILVQNGIASRMAGFFSGTHTGIARQYGGFNTYTVTTNSFNGIWDDIFINAFRNARLSASLAEEQGISGVTIGITQVLEALSAGTATSLFGDIPFDQLSNVQFDNPEFESQLQVYGKIQTLLDNAIVNLSAGGGRPAVGSEIFFNGDPVAWIAVANTIKARYYMHTGEYAAAYAAAQNGISIPVHSMLGAFGEAIEASNLNWQQFENESQGDDLIMSDFLVSMLDATANEYRGNSKTNEIARYNYLFGTNPNGVILNTSRDGFAGQTAPARIVTYEENLLILAEAAIRSVDFATALTHLNDFRSYMSSGGYLNSPNLSDLQYDAYVANDFANGGIENVDGLSADNALLREVLEERYITLLAQIEVFNDVRRTLNETIVRVPVVPNVGTALPERFLYAQSEIERNTNIPSEIPGLFVPTEVNQ